MVKLPLFMLASSLAATSAATIELGNDRLLRRGDPITESLLKKARPYKTNKNESSEQASRRLEGNYFDGSYNIKFSRCVDVKLLDDDIFADEYLEYAKAEQITPSKSFVLFHVCLEDDCFYESEDDLYIVDLATYIKTVAAYHANVRTNYCQACLDYADTCNVVEAQYYDDDDDGEAAYGDDYNYDYGDDYGYVDDAAADEVEADDANMADENVEQDDAMADDLGQVDDAINDVEGDDQDADVRKLKQKRQKLSRVKRPNRRLKTPIDCDQCDAYKCFQYQDDAQQTQEQLDSDVADWIVDLAGCQETGEQWDGMDLYVGAICSPYGDGAELAVFIDEYCFVYTNQKAFKDVYNPYYNDNYDTDYSYYAETYIKNAFSEVMPCESTQYTDPNDYDDGYNYDDGLNYMNDYCEALFNRGATDFSNCGDNDYSNQKTYLDDDQYKWYSFDMTYENAQNIEKVCYIVNQMSGEYDYAYDETGSGTWYVRDKDGNVKEPNQFSLEDLPLQLIGIISGAVAALLGITCCICTIRNRRLERSQPLYQGGALL